MVERKSTKAANPTEGSPEPGFVEGVLTGVRPEAFWAGAAKAAKARREKAEAKERQAAAVSANIAKRREHLAQLIKIAAEVAAKAKAKGIEPEFAAEHTHDEHRKNVLPAINRVERPKKVIRQDHKTHAEGWLLARKAGVVDKKMLVQEATLGIDGRIHVYMRDDIANASTLLREESYSRKTVQEANNQQITQPWESVHVAHSLSGEAYHATVISGESYPFFGTEERPEETSKSITPEAIQRGLEEFVDEYGLLPDS